MRKFTIRAQEITIRDVIALAKCAEGGMPTSEALTEMIRIVVRYTDLTENEVLDLPVAGLNEIVDQIGAALKAEDEKALPPS